MVVIIIILGIIITFALSAYQIFIKRILKEKKKQHEIEIQHQKNLLSQNIKIQESERERIAILLHDDVGNKLNVLSVWLNNPDTWNNERSKEIITRQIPDLIECTRNISHSLYPVNLERFGLVLSIEEMIANVESSLEMELYISDEYQPRNISIEVQLYRIIQEFLSNVIKHSQANQMTIQLRDSASGLSLILADNGKGFDLEELKKGMGLRNIELRIKSLDGIFKWKSKINFGCRLIILIQKNEREN